MEDSNKHEESCIQEDGTDGYKNKESHQLEEQSCKQESCKREISHEKKSCQQDSCATDMSCSPDMQTATSEIQVEHSMPESAVIQQVDLGSIKELLDSPG